MVPPDRSTKCFAIASPSPVPGAPPLCTKRSNSFLCSPIGIPGPVSAHSKTTFLPYHRIDIFIDPDAVYLIAFVITFVKTCCILCLSPRTQSLSSVSYDFKNWTDRFTDESSIWWISSSRFDSDIGAGFRVIFPSSIFRTSRRLFIIEDMKLLQSLIPCTRLFAESLISSGIAFKALSIAPKGLRNSWAKYAVMFRSVSTFAS
mmetsp:Transcript_11224/g.16478  ORF Transcript_11224/g.16478 Transcript_11224/m.16478 type:complete len:203 (+) Transcript_11224:550-1158(+)